MPRPSLNTVRTTEVLSAYLETVAQKGFEGATLQAIADKAEMARPLVRHHLGNKCEMFDRLVAYVLTQFDEQTIELVDALPPMERVSTLLDILFSPAAESSSDLILVFADLTAKAGSVEGLAAKIAGSISNFETAILCEIQREFPTVDPIKQSMVAHGIVALYFNATSLTPVMTCNSVAKHAATALVETLSNESK